MSSNTDSISRRGVVAVGLLFEELGWAFREQPTSDFGIDAQAEKRGRDGMGTGRLIALQIKSGPSWFKPRGKDYVFYGEARHLEYWTSHSLPVFIILHDPENQLTLFQRVERHLVKLHSGGRWSITIPASNTLHADHEPFLAAGIAPDEESVRRYRIALDLPLIERFGEEDHAWLRLEEWNNKTLNFRGTEVIFDENPEAEADFELDWAAAVLGVPRFMELFFPWLDYDIYAVDDDLGSGEITMHILEVRLSAVGKAVLLLENYFSDGLPERSDDETEQSFDPDHGDYLVSLDDRDGDAAPPEQDGP